MANRRYSYRRKSKNNDNVFTLASLFTAGIILIILIFKAIIGLIKWIAHLFIEDNTSSDSIKNTNKDNTIVLNKKIKEENNIIKTPYDKLFESRIKFRGINYFNNKKINNYSLNNRVCTAEILGTDIYQTSIVFYKNKNIKKATCTCPYYIKEDKYCKHIYALILEYCTKEKVVGFINNKMDYNETNINLYSQMLDICNSMNEIINDIEEYYIYNEIIDDADVDKIYNEILEYQEKINYYSNIKPIDIDKKVIRLAYNDLNILNDLYENFKEECETIIENNEYEEKLEQEDEFIDGITSYYIINEHEKKSKNK